MDQAGETAQEPSIWLTLLMQFFVGGWLEWEKCCLKNLARNDADQLDCLHALDLTSKSDNTEDCHDAAVVGHIRDNDPGLLPAHDDIRSWVLYWSREQERQLNHRSVSSVF